MFNVGGMELVAIALIALIVLGPQRLPGAIRQMGQIMGELRRISSGFQTDFRSAMEDMERDAEREARESADQTAAGASPVTAVEPAPAPRAVDEPDGSSAAAGPPLPDTSPPAGMDDPAPLFGVADDGDAPGRAAS